MEPINPIDLTSSEAEAAEENDEADLLPTYCDDGVDLTLIRWMLSLSPLERLRTAQRYANSAHRLRHAPRREFDLKAFLETRTHDLLNDGEQGKEKSIRMTSTKQKSKYVLGADADIQGKEWHKGDTVYCLPLTGPKEGFCDLFLTPHPEYARRGSRAPVYRTLAEYLEIEGETLVIAHPNADEQL